MPIASHKKHPARRPQSGFSMVELLIAVALGIILSWAILDVTLTSSRTAREVELTSEMVENGRYLSQLLKSEVHLAGFYGRVSRYIDATVAAQPDQCTGLSTASLTDGISFPIYGQDGVAAGTKICGGDTLLAGSDTLLIRRADTQFINTTTGLNASQHYIQETVSGYVLQTGTNNASFNLLEKDGSVAAIREFHQTIYYVDDSNVFKRLRLVNGAYQPEPLVEGVDDFQVVYGIDRSGDGIANADAGNPAYVEIPATAADWQNVVSLKIFLVLSSTQPGPGLADGKAYTYADKVSVTFPDSKKRNLFSSVARLTNVSIKRAGL